MWQYKDHNLQITVVGIDVEKRWGYLEYARKNTVRVAVAAAIHIAETAVLGIHTSIYDSLHDMQIKVVFASI